MRRGAVCAVVVFVAVVLQATIVDRVPLPGDGGPDIVLLLVVALGLTRGERAGALAGFFAGVGLDLAPPATHPIGELAFVFCVVGYGCGWIGGRLSSGAARLVFALVGAATGAILQAAAAQITGEPGGAISGVFHVLAPAVLYDVLLMPAVLLLVSAAGGSRRAARPGGVPAAASRRDAGGIRAATTPAIGLDRGRRGAIGRLHRTGSRPAALSGRPPRLRSRPVRLRLRASRAVRLRTAARARLKSGRRIGAYR